MFHSPGTLLCPSAPPLPLPMATTGVLQRPRLRGTVHAVASLEASGIKQHVSLSSVWLKASTTATPAVQWMSSQCLLLVPVTFFTGVLKDRSGMTSRRQGSYSGRTVGASALYSDSGNVYSDSGHSCRYSPQVAAEVSDCRSDGPLLRQLQRLLRQRPFLQILTTSGSRSVGLSE